MKGSTLPLTQVWGRESRRKDSKLKRRVQEVLPVNPHSSI